MNQVGSPRTALVTGASRGIGRAIALGLARQGYILALNDIERQAHELEQVQREIEALGASARKFRADVRDATGVRAMVAAFLAEFEKLDVIVNNAGILIAETVDALSEQQWDDVLDVNAKGTFIVTQAALPTMRARRYGRIVNIASIGGKHGAPGQAHYSASKAAVLGYTRVLAQEIGADNITANCVCPGIIVTEMGRTNLQTQAATDKAIASTALRRLGQPEDVVGAVCFLASDDAAFITGQSLNVCGGIRFD